MPVHAGTLTRRSGSVMRDHRLWLTLFRSGTPNTCALSMSSNRANSGRYVRDAIFTKASTINDRNIAAIRYRHRACGNSKKSWLAAFPCNPLQSPPARKSRALGAANVQYRKRGYCSRSPRRKKGGMRHCTKYRPYLTPGLQTAFFRLTQWRDAAHRPLARSATKGGGSRRPRPAGPDRCLVRCCLS